MKWFKHDATANMDAKLQDVILEYGMEGYGLYWYCLELIASNVSPENLTFELEHDSRIIARNTGLGVQKVQEIMTHFTKIGLFDNAEGRITCLKLAKRADDYTAKLTRAMVAQVIENKQLRESPTNSEKVPLEQIRLDKNRLDKNKQNTYAKPNGVRVPVSEIVNLYHEKLPNHPRIVKLTKTREGYLKQRWREDMDSLDAWAEYFEYVSKSSFLTGKEPPSQGRHSPFVADLEWLTKPGNIAKVVEGKYHG